MAIDGVPVAVDGADGIAVGGPDLAGSLTVSEFHQLLDEAVSSAGLVHLWVTGTVTGLRPGPEFTSLELVDYEDDGATVRRADRFSAVGEDLPDMVKANPSHSEPRVRIVLVTAWCAQVRAPSRAKSHQA